MCTDTEFEAMVEKLVGDVGTMPFYRILVSQVISSVVIVQMWPREYAVAAQGQKAYARKTDFTST